MSDTPLRVIDTRAVANHKRSHLRQHHPISTCIAAYIMWAGYRWYDRIGWTFGFVVFVGITWRTFDWPHLWAILSIAFLGAIYAWGAYLYIFDRSRIRHWHSSWLIEGTYSQGDSVAHMLPPLDNEHPKPAGHGRERNAILG